MEGWGWEDRTSVNMTLLPHPPPRSVNTLCLSVTTNTPVEINYAYTAHLNLSPEIPTPFEINMGAFWQS